MVKEKKTNAVQISWKAVRYLMPIAWKENKQYIFLQIIKLIADILFPFVEIICMPLIIKELFGARRPEVVLTYIAILVVGNGLLYWISSFTNIASQKGNIVYGNYLSHQVMMKGMELDFSMTENRKVLDQVEKAKQGITWYSNGIPGILEPFFQIIRNVIVIAGVLVLILQNAPIMVLVSLAVVVLQALINRELIRIEMKGFHDLSAINRAFSYTLYQLSEFQYAKDIRLYEATDMMMEKTNEEINGLTSVWRRQAKENRKWQVLMRIINCCNTAIVYIYLGLRTIRGILSVDIFTRMVTSIRTFTSSINGLVNAIMNLGKRSEYINEYIKYMEFPSVFLKGTRKVKEGKHTIEFRDVSFAYPNTDVQVIKHLSIKLTEGEHLSVVGLNGAGKTTFIKLLCRLYDIDEGEILLDGVSIKEYDYEDYMKLLAVVFQDFKLLAFSMKENIALDVDATKEELEEICNTVGLKECVENLPHGIDTVMWKQFDEEGVELSGGQQQKLAIARALFKNSSIAILDEPTAALDPIAEYEIYRQFNHLVGGKTAVYISHRLSSCKFCDHIAVFSEGTIKEYGTHDELVGIPGGIYATMFQAQAQYYQ